MDHEILQEVTELERKQQGGKRGPVWMCGKRLNGRKKSLT